jgi:NAD(P)-dependent dehydrogenase (short-subunit alcohol dehydrogenase family)
MDLGLSGKVALVTGGARDVGREIALTLAREGAAVAVNYRSSQAEADATVADIRKNGGKAAAASTSWSTTRGWFSASASSTRRRPSGSRRSTSGCLASFTAVTPWRRTWFARAAAASSTWQAIPRA